ncbi:AI-2E family transporter [Novosphingobium endophyticum]|uniref:AI-2E family transporter n=1 Tax=Novosphingobium endophyticum TaxID=1955250 RepID=A0A916X758_9SPHN|nr:AI-2E family transporter [Novosphingobium endophyticum]GGC14533.1 AI-2E family transporter [Novosphingobium endophyticum]
METKPPSHYSLEDYAFIGLVMFVTVIFAWLLAPYFGAILWGIVAAILFEPMTRRLERRLGGRANTAAALMLMLLLAIFILPTLILGASLVREATSLYNRIVEGQIDLGGMLQQILTILPERLREMIGSYTSMDFETLRREFGSGIAGGLQDVAGRLLIVGQGALKFIAAMGVMLYLTFFLLRDGERYAELVRTAIPLRPHLRDALASHFIVVVRATMKGTVVVAVLQGFVGGVIFAALGIEGALLWGVLMGFFSLLPAIGTGIVWIPVAGYLLATGSYTEGGIMIFCGVFIIGMIDNLLRPILVGRDTRMPDFVVLIATLAGLELFGLNGFIVGPMIAALFIAVWNLVSDAKNGLIQAEAPEIPAPGVDPEAEAEAQAHPG